MNKVIISKWALIPGVLLLIVTYVLAGLAAMNAEDFQREMTSLETAVSLTPLVPVIWILLIAIYPIIRNKNQKIIIEKTSIIIIPGILLSIIAALLLFMQ